VLPRLVPAIEGRSPIVGRCAKPSPGADLIPCDLRRSSGVPDREKTGRRVRSRLRIRRTGERGVGVACFPGERSPDPRSTDWERSGPAMSALDVRPCVQASCRNRRSIEGSGPTGRGESGPQNALGTPFLLLAAKVPGFPTANACRPCGSLPRDPTPGYAGQRVLTERAQRS
jgi:hypothetical protein